MYLAAFLYFIVTEQAKISYTNVIEQFQSFCRQNSSAAIGLHVLAVYVIIFNIRKWWLQNLAAKFDQLIC